MAIELDLRKFNFLKILNKVSCLFNSLFRLLNSMRWILLIMFSCLTIASAYLDYNQNITVLFAVISGMILSNNLKLMKDR